MPRLLVGLAGSFMAGVLMEVHHIPISGPNWLFVLGAPLVITVWAAIAVALALGEARQFIASVLLGAFLTSLAFMVGILGTFFPFAAGLGHRELELYGGDISTWDHWLTFSLAFSGMGGALFGAFGGFLSWLLRRLSTAHVNGG